MAKRGKTPSLIGSGAGASRFMEASGKRKCKRCESAIGKGIQCVEVTMPGSFGHRTYCRSCYGDILDQTGKNLARLRRKLETLG